MPNDLATMNGYLDVALRDTGDETWTSTEKNNLITWAIAQLGSRMSKRATATLAISPTMPWYDLSSLGLSTVDRVDLYNGSPFSASSKRLMALPGGSWEITGDILSGSSPQLYINPIYSVAGHYLLLHGTAKFDASTSLVPDRYVPAVLAVARAEAYRRVTAERARFKNWLAKNQVQNISVNELIQMVNEADAEAQRLMGNVQITGKPVPGRVG